jgi:hypothetical protein
MSDTRSDEQDAVPYLASVENLQLASLQEGCILQHARHLPQPDRAAAALWQDWVLSCPLCRKRNFIFSLFFPAPYGVLAVEGDSSQLSDWNRLFKNTVLISSKRGC